MTSSVWRSSTSTRRFPSVSEQLFYISLGTNGVLSPPLEVKAVLLPWLKEVSESVYFDGDSGTQIVCRKAYFLSRHLRRELNYRSRKDWIVHNFQLTC